jgi:hypothetical protein
MQFTVEQHLAIAKVLREHAEGAGEARRERLIKRSNSCVTAAVFAAKNRGAISTAGFGFDLLSPEWSVIDNQISRLGRTDDEPEIIYVCPTTAAQRQDALLRSALTEPNWDEDTPDFEDDDTDRTRFPFSIDDKPKIEKLSNLVRESLPSMNPVDLRVAATVLFALERLPDSTPGIQVTFGFSQPNTDGNYGWADIEISEDEFRLTTGEHFYDPGVGGDTETRILFEAQVGGHCLGEINEWLPVANVIAFEGRVSAEDYSDYDVMDWEAQPEPDAWDSH